MTMDEINQVERAMDGFYVGYATVSSLKGIRTQQYVFNMTPENISGSKTLSTLIQKSPGNPLKIRSFRGF